MACRRCLTTLTRQTTSLFSTTATTTTTTTTNHLLKPLSSLLHHHLLPTHRPFSTTPSQPPTHTNPPPHSPKTHFPINENDEEEEDDDDDEDEEDYTSADEDDVEKLDGNVGKRSVLEPACLEERSYYVDDKLQEAADIGYKVVGPLKPDDRVFKHYEPAFAVVQVGSHQFKVSNGDCIYVEKLKYCEVNDKLLLKKVLMVGSPTQTIIGRPILPEAAVHAIVEEHALDAKVIIFKKKRRKNYRRTRGHRQELTRLRITDIQGIEKTEAPLLGKAKKKEKVAVAA